MWLERSSFRPYICWGRHICEFDSGTIWTICIYWGKRIRGFNPKSLGAPFIFCRKPGHVYFSLSPLTLSNFVMMDMTNKRWQLGFLEKVIRQRDENLDVWDPYQTLKNRQHAYILHTIIRLLTELGKQGQLLKSTRKMAMKKVAINRMHENKKASGT